MAIKKEALSEYEIARQEKIAKNQALLHELQLDAQQTGIGPQSKPKPAATAGQKRKRPAAERVKKEVEPRRTSARLQGIVADSEVAREKEEKEAVKFQEEQRIKRQRVSDDIDLHNALVTGTNWDQSGNWLTNVGPAAPGQRTFTAQDVKDTTDKDLKALRERMSSLQLWEGAEPNRIKITPDRIYALGFHPTDEKPLVFAGDKFGNIGLFDASQTTPQQIKAEAAPEADDDVDDEVEPAITTFKIHTRTISALTFAPSDPNALYTCSYDSSIRRLDLTKGVATEAYAPSDREADDPLSGVEISRADPNLLYFSTLNGYFGLHDLRTPAHQTSELLLLSEKKIGGFSLNPAAPNILATASLDRTLRIWDLRRLSGKGSSRTPQLLGEHTSRLSVSHAAFNAAGQVATSSYDDTVKIYTAPSPASPLANPEEDFTPTTVIPHNNQTGRWVTILRPHWQFQPPPLSASKSGSGDGIQKFCIGNMNRFVDIYTSEGKQVAQLGGAGITAVPAVARFHERREWVAAGTASGKLCLWM